MRNRATLRFHCYTLEEVSSNRTCRSNIRSVSFQRCSSPFIPRNIPFLLSFSYFIYRIQIRFSSFKIFLNIFYPSRYLFVFFLSLPLFIPHITEDRVDRYYFCYFFVIGTTSFDFYSLVIYLIFSVFSFLLHLC